MVCVFKSSHHIHHSLIALEMKLKLEENKRKIQEPALAFYQKAFGMRVLPVQGR
jgi:hypothetical protein